jgi:hypothetical protein
VESQDLLELAKRRHIHPCYETPRSDFLLDAAFRQQCESYVADNKERTAAWAREHRYPVARVRYVRADGNCAMNALNYLHYHGGQTPSGTVDPSRQWLADMVQSPPTPLHQAWADRLRIPAHDLFTANGARTICACRVCITSGNDAATSKSLTPSVNTSIPLESVEDFRWRTVQPNVEMDLDALTVVCHLRFGYELVLFHVNSAGDVARLCFSKLPDWSVPHVPPFIGRVYLVHEGGHFSPLVLASEGTTYNAITREMRVFPCGEYNSLFEDSVRIECARLHRYRKYVRACPGPDPLQSTEAVFAESYTNDTCWRKKRDSFEHLNKRVSVHEYLLHPLRVPLLDDFEVALFVAASTNDAQGETPTGLCCPVVPTGFSGALQVREPVPHSECTMRRAFHSDRVYDVERVRAAINKLPPITTTDVTMSQRILAKHVDAVKGPAVGFGEISDLPAYILARCQADCFVPAFCDGWCAFWAAGDAFGLPPPLLMRLALAYMDSTTVDHVSRCSSARDFANQKDKVARSLAAWNNLEIATNPPAYHLNPQSYFWDCLATIFDINICVVYQPKLQMRLIPPQEFYAVSRATASVRTTTPRHCYPVLDSRWMCFWLGGDHFNFLGRRHAPSCLALRHASLTTSAKERGIEITSGESVEPIPPLRHFLPEVVWPRSPGDMIRLHHDIVEGSTGSACWCVRSSLTLDWEGMYP